MNSSRKEMKKTKVEIIPMIDTMFFLLVFFILQSLDIIKLKGINITLPKAADKASPVEIDQTKNQPDEIVLSIEPNGQIFVDKIQAQPEQIGDLLRQNLTQQKQRNPKLTKAVKELLPEVTVIISADPAAAYDRMVRCIDESRKAGVVKFALAAPEGAKP